MLRSCVGCMLLFGASLPLNAQTRPASPYLPLDHRAMPWVEYLIALGAMPDPDPLTRPLRLHAVRHALATVDTLERFTHLAPVVRRVAAVLPADSLNPGYLVGVAFGGTAGTDARRDPLRPAGQGHVSPYGALWLEGRLGPLVLISNSYFERRLRFDPDYTGTIAKARRIPGRFENAYASLELGMVELAAGRLSRNWGPLGGPGLFVSDVPYSFNHAALRLGGRGARVEILYARLDDALSGDGAVIRRYWSALRAVFRPWDGVTGSIIQGVLWRGAAEAFNLMWINPLELIPFTREDEPIPDSANVMVGGQFEVRLGGGQTIAGELLVDDVSTQDVQSAPWRLGGTLSAGTPLGRHVRLDLRYTFVSSLAYRTSQGPDFAYVRNGIGLARNFDDYDRASLRLTTALPRAAGLLGLEAVLLRQGEGDIRTPFTLPDRSPFLHIGVVERTLRVALDARAVVAGQLSVDGSAGLHFIQNAAHVAGASDTRFVGRLRAVWHLEFPLRPD